MRLHVIFKFKQRNGIVALIPFLLAESERVSCEPEIEKSLESPIQPFLLR